jgi:DNA-binding MurR/RpiR family transcriptional regulator
VSDTPNLPATIQTALQALPELPRHYNPIRALPESDRGQLLDTILAHYECGTSIYDLAEKLGVDNATLYRQLVKHRPDEWQEVRGARYHSQIEEAEKSLKEAADPLAVTRAREQLANARWMLERLQRKIYGQDAGQSVAAVQINIGIRKDAAASHNEVIEVELPNK